GSKGRSPWGRDG
ncbi:hypothetical protein STRIP9103_07651, partial [Streptomyces ipomoeae 91-03]